MTKKIYEDNKEKLLYFPSPISVYHNVKGGLLYQLSTMMRSAVAFTKIYPKVKKDLLFAGAMLHDIGKLYELEVDVNGKATDYTKECNLLDHIALGIKMLNNAYLELSYELLSDENNEIELESEILMLLEHIISSHYFEENWGSIFETIILEAELIHHIDMIDSRVYQINEISNGFKRWRN